jgi:hypothetical protein
MKEARLCTPVGDTPLLRSTLTRRRFLCSTTLAILGGTLGAPNVVRSQANGHKLNVAVIGTGGKGESDTTDTVAVGGNIVALCDVDQRLLDKNGAKFPTAKKYNDFRKLLEEMGKSIDAVTVSTPDHCHAPASVLAMKMGKHVYCQKPLTYSVYEARLMQQLAKEKKLVTQMGNQGSAGDGLRRAVEVVQAGVIGPVKQLHVWSNRPIWPQGMERPSGEDLVPDTVRWDLWLGPAPFRPYKEGVYLPVKWRGWQDFGTGALGDMACHTVNMPFRALKLGYPASIEAETSPMNKETYPLRSKIKFDFPAREDMPPLSFWWYDGGNPRPGKPFEHDGTNKPAKEILGELVDMYGEKIPGSGCLLLGDKGKLFSPDDYGSEFYLMLNGEKSFKNGRDHEAAKAVPITIPRSPGHNKEWVNAILGGPPPYSNFDIAVPLTEIVLLGCVALRMGKKVEWDGPNMKSPNCPEADQYIKRQYAKGYEL